MPRQYGVTESALRRLEAGTYNEAEGEILWWPYYDAVDLATGGTDYSFFSTPLGQAGKKLDVTNFPAANQMPQAQNFEVRAIEMYYIPSAAKSIAELQEIQDAFKEGYFLFGIQNKADQLQLPLTQFMGASFPLHVTGGTAGDQLTSRSRYNGVWETPVEIILAAKVNFNCEIKFTTGLNAALNGDRILISLVGGLIRLQ